MYFVFVCRDKKGLRFGLVLSLCFIISGRDMPSYISWMLLSQVIIRTGIYINTSGGGEGSLYLGWCSQGSIIAGSDDGDVICTRIFQRRRARLP